MVRKLSNGFLRLRRNAPVVQRSVDLAFGTRRERSYDTVIFCDALGYICNELFRLERSMGRLAKGEIGFPTPYRILDGFNDGRLELLLEGFVVPKETCCKCIFNRSIDFAED